MTAFNFCCKFDDLETNSIADYKKPTAIPRGDGVYSGGREGHV
jgi:hypothetical protein